MFDPKGAGRVICCLRPGQNKSSLKRFQCGKLTNAWEELQRHGEAQTAPEFDLSEIEALFSAAVQNQADKSGSRREAFEANPDKLQLSVQSLLQLCFHKSMRLIILLYFLGLFCSELVLFDLNR
jgi:hypothetical protein